MFDINGKRFRTYQSLGLDTEFFKGDSTLNRAWATADLAKSGLSVDDIVADCPTTLKLPEHATAGYHIPYWGLDGKPLVDKNGVLTMRRTRFRYPEWYKGQRYDQPSAAELLPYNLPGHLPYIHPIIQEMDSDTLVIAEGEKKAVSIIKHRGLPAIGIGGYQMWRDPMDSNSVHRWIIQVLARGYTKVIIVPDADLFRYDICAGYGTHANALIRLGYSVEILNPPDKIDDLLCAWGEGAAEGWEGIPRVTADRLGESISSLATRFSLGFRKSDKGTITVHQNSANITTLLKEHPAFPPIWLDLDKLLPMVGDVAVQSNLQDMQIANHMQHYFQMDKVTNTTVRACIAGLCVANRKSPMLERIQHLAWDGKKRLDTWLTDYWGVEDSPYLREIAVKWLVSACARLAEPGCKVDWMFITIGPQGTGKSSMPRMLYGDNVLILYGDNGDKDMKQLVNSRLCVCFDELDSFSRKDQEFLKALISTQEDDFRLPYGAVVERFQRRNVLYGSGNNPTFLQSDPSGYRRYAIIEVNQKLDFHGLKAAADQLWAEAWMRYQQGGVNYWEVSEASERAKNFVHETPMEAAIGEILDERTKATKFSKEPVDPIGTTTIVDALRAKGMPVSNNDRTIAATMHKLGYEYRSVRLQDGPRKRWVPKGTPTL